MPTPMPIMAPSVTAKSGTDMTFESRVMMPAPIPTPNSATPIGRPMAGTEPNEEDQDVDCEAETDQLGFGRFELAERLATDLHLETIDVGRPQIRDLGTDLAGLGFAERLRKIDLPRRRPVPRAVRRWRPTRAPGPAASTGS